jgi:small subunit ribosomal protein S12
MSTIHQSGSKLKGKKKKHVTRPLRSFFKSPQKKGMATKFRLMSPKKPNSAKRRIVRLRLSNKYMVTAKIKGQGHSLQVYAEVLVCGGRANDLPGVRYNMIRGKYGFSWKEKIFRIKARSKYGIRLDDFIWLAEEQYAKDKVDNDNTITENEQIRLTEGGITDSTVNEFIDPESSRNEKTISVVTDSENIIENEDDINENNI